jgi:outer membrane protein
MRELLLALFVTCPAAALALQPLPSFVESARGFNPDTKAAMAQKAVREAQATAVLGQTLPSLQARLALTRNQYNVVFDFPLNGPAAPPTRLTISPYNQIDGRVTLSVPLINLASFVNVTAANHGADASREQAKAVALQVEAQVVQTYFQLVADQALVAAAKKALDVAQENVRLTQEQVTAGRAATLDLDRAQANLEQQRQALVQAELGVALAARALTSASGLQPEVGAPVALSDDLHEEAPLDTFQRPSGDLPAVAAAVEARRSAESAATAQELALVPALNGSFIEQGTNATALLGHEFVYAAILALTWQLDVTTFANISAQSSAADVARAQQERTELAARDDIYRTWATVGSAIARSRSARAEQQAATHAASLAQARYEVGGATQLDLLQATRDAFGADVSRISADADLANARLQLRLAAGLDPFASKGN